MLGARAALGYRDGVAEPLRKILVVDDSRTQLDWLVAVLQREGYDVREATTGREALVKVRSDPPDLVLLDKILPDMDGLEVLRHIKGRPGQSFIPVIVLSVRGDVESKVAGLRIGADDFLAKPFAEQEIVARCTAMLRIKALQDQLRAAQTKLEEQSITDGLTGLKNRRLFDERLAEEFGRAQRYADPVSLIMIDLDHFKQVNDRYGHQMGDLVLREAAAAIRASIRDPDICARYGGEEFAVILPKTHVAGAMRVAERIWRELGTRVYHRTVTEGGHVRTVEVRITASIGVAFYPAPEITSAELLVKLADEALYQAKRSGRNTICVYQVAV
jgi:diguanylate cyclase (GGDEF)-like protein